MNVCSVDQGLHNSNWQVPNANDGQSDFILPEGHMNTILLIEILSLACAIPWEKLQVLSDMCGQLSHLETRTTLTLTTPPPYCCFTVIQDLKEYKD